MLTDEIRQQIKRQIRLPQEGEYMGVVLETLGGARMKVYCEDGKERLCRIPGKFRSRMWVKEGDFVIVKPWDIQGDRKGDIVYRYRPLETEYLREIGRLQWYGE